MAATEIPAAERAPESLTGAGNATLQFLGGAGTVTGAMYRIHTSAGDILLDCGLFQGLKQLRLRNWSIRVPDAASIAAVVLSHAHIDHVGYLPLLVRHGFRGPVYCTAGTADLVRVLLPDCAHLQEEEAERANRRRYSKHHPALPLYTAQDAEAVGPLLHTRSYDTSFSILRDVTGLLRPAGHILGSAIVELEIDHRQLVYTGDLGRERRAMGAEPAPIANADVLLLESTYGDRQHPGGGKQDLARVVNDAARRGGALLIPAFAVDRTQEIVSLLDQLETDGAIPELPVYLDSPLAIEATEIYARRGAFRVPSRYRFARTPEESKALNELRGPVIIISASGMATGGRVLHHLAMRLPDERTTVLLVGFQSAGTRGRLLADGAREIKMLGQVIPVRAHIERIDALSAHADRDEIMAWLRRFARPPGMTYLVHGEPAAAQALLGEITQRLGWRVRVALDGETVPLA